MTAVLAPVEQAAYRVLVQYRMTADQRRAAAKEVANALSQIPVELLPGVVNLGQHSGIVADLLPKLWAVPVPRRREAAAVAVAAAAEAFCEATS